MRPRGWTLLDRRRRPFDRRRWLLPAALALVAALAGACRGPILANPPLDFSPPPTAAPTPTRPADPIPIELPRDDAPHDRLTEWWYYTGHLVADDGRRFGFEAVIFRAERGALPVSWASHLALTDESGGRFLYAQRSEIGPYVDRSPIVSERPLGFALAISGTAAADPAAPAGSPVAPWFLYGAPSGDRIDAALTPTEAAAAGGSFGLSLSLTSTKPAVLHGAAGWIDFGAAGGSYYYSRTALDVGGTLDVDGTSIEVSGTAWFDHQWGDFISVGAGGWDWFAVNLADGTDLTISLVRAPDGTYPLVYGTLVRADGAVRHLGAGDFSVAVRDHWTSPTTGITYPAAWRVALPGEGLVIDLTPTVADQELDTTATTGVVYWEGSQVVRATRDGTPVGGEAYVELTGYGAGHGG
jgi:predicted secreted hydrolase